jgi:hypothetical protein
MKKRKKFTTVLEWSDGLINQFSGDEIVSKFNLKAKYIGKLKVKSYKNTLQLADTNSEGVKAQEILKDQIRFRKLDFTTTDTKRN